ncbi:hypothetical protein JRI60_43755 [Archangium violaceum]|uniref:hypothetical protein n=1 Tax=Archangium violaceum TaxID=83451 RepID=UPI00194E030D|nr:hypothetical protein [Archangium violaceum]QRN95891.1 hypothetical protein JRI60_43755 [Archangium violaceum]
MTLPSGVPRTECEREEWYELAPARVLSTASQGGGTITYTYYKEYIGFGVFKAGDDDPESLSDVWPILRDNELQRRHEARIAPVDEANTRVLLWSAGGLVGMFGGIGGAAAIQKQDRTAAAVLGVGGLALGVAGLIGALVSGPSVHDVLEAGARRKLLLPQEDDVRAAAHGLNTTNTERRRRCEQRAPAPPQQPAEPVGAVKSSTAVPPSAPEPIRMPSDAPTLQASATALPRMVRP